MLHLKHFSRVSSSLATCTSSIFTRGKGKGVGKRFYSSEITDPRQLGLLPLFGRREIQDQIQKGLEEDGFCIIKNFAGEEIATKMREEAEVLYEGGHMFQSMSTDENGQLMAKPNVFASELDGHEWELAPTILNYTLSVILQAPTLLNFFFPELDLTDQTYGTKLAVSLGAGSNYPKHCDNSGLPDRRKVTMVYYLNPQWDPSQGGKLRIFTKEETIFSVDPKADTLAMFWSDQIVHDVTPTTSSSIDIKEARRYALTLWLVSDNDEEIVNTKHPLYPNRQKHFPC